MKKQIPNLLTATNLFFGMVAMVFIFIDNLTGAMIAVLISLVMDFLDGFVARMLKVQGPIGKELDSLADFVNFGVAPAIIMFIWSLEDLKSLGWIAVLVFAVCSALRLARFNVSLGQTDQPAWKKSFFVGVPAPAGAIIVLLPIYAQDLGLHWPSLTPLVLLYTVAVALLMVSNVPTISIKMLGQRIHREYVPPLFVLAALFMALLLTYPAHTLFVGSLVYLALIPVSAYRYVLAKRKAEEHAKAQNGAGASNEGSTRQAGPERHV